MEEKKMFWVHSFAWFALVMLTLGALGFLTIFLSLPETTPQTDKIYFIVFLIAFVINNISIFYGAITGELARITIDKDGVRSISLFGKELEFFTWEEIVCIYLVGQTRARLFTKIIFSKVYIDSQNYVFRGFSRKKLKKYEQIALVATREVIEAIQEFYDGDIGGLDLHRKSLHFDEKKD
ncbi:hypothetical protein LJC20_05040 [Eubacteriales bacterium OttesenSCG-928-M02]|nr:hypothetical protein [Eubacteriales bacterium OttesenSCG-928-M02]